MKEFFQIAAVATAVSVAIFLVLLIPVYYTERSACVAAWSEHNPEYHFFGGCVVTWGGKRVPSKAIRQIGVNQ